MNASKELLAGRMDKQWLVPVADSGPTRIPRVCASVRAAYFEGKPQESVIVHPEIEYWELNTRNRILGIEYWELRFDGEPASKTIVLEFDSYPSLPSELSSTRLSLRLKSPVIFRTFAGGMREPFKSPIQESMN